MFMAALLTPLSIHDSCLLHYVAPLNHETSGGKSANPEESAFLLL